MASNLVPSSRATRGTLGPQRQYPPCRQEPRSLAAPGMTTSRTVPPVVIIEGMRYRLRFLWNATRRHRLAPWRSPYLLWRIETYCGVKMTQIGFLEFWEFLWRERTSLWRFLKWTAEMERYAHPKPKS
jgi:hypothetical protein